jgi:hypothetical protein
MTSYNLAVGCVGNQKLTRHLQKGEGASLPLFAERRLLAAVRHQGKLIRHSLDGRKLANRKLI